MFKINAVANIEYEFPETYTTLMKAVDAVYEEIAALSEESDAPNPMKFWNFEGEPRVCTTPTGWTFTITETEE